MKRLIGLILSGAIAAAMIPQAFAEETSTALDEAFYRIDNGTAFLKADTTWERNNATQAEKTAAVLDYVNEYLTGVLSGVTAAVAYDNGAYSVTLSENGESKTLSLTAMDFAYYVQGAADDFNYIGENTVPNYTLCVITDEDLNSTINLAGYEYNGIVAINEDTNSHFAKLFSRFQDEYVLNPIGKSYVYKTRIKVDDFINIPENKQVGDEWHTALTTVKNQVTDLEFTIEADGVYYKTVNEENTAVWKKIQGYTTDTDWHDYKVIVKNGIASMYIDNIETLTDIVLPAEAGYVDYPGMTFGYLSGSEKTAESDNVSVSLDYFDIKNLYEHEVFIADMSGFENQNIFLNEDNAYQTQKLTVGNKEVSAYYSNTAEEKNLIYKLPENASIKDVKLVGYTPSTMDLFKYYPGYMNKQIILRNQPASDLTSSIALYPYNVQDSTGQCGSGIYNVFLRSDACNDLNSKEFDILKIYSPIVNGKKKPIIRLEIEYDYFYSAEDKVVLADDMNFSVPANLNQYFGYSDWSYNLENTGWTGYGWSGGYGNGNDDITGTYFKNAAQIVQLYKPFHTDFGDEYTYSSDIWIDKAAAEKAQSDLDLITDIISGSGYELKFSPCIKDSSVKYWANGENGAEWKTAENITIKDKEFNACRAVVKNGTAILYVNGNKVAEYNMPNGTLQYTPGYGEDPDRKAIIAVLREEGTQTGNDVVSRIKNILIVDNSEPELIAGIRALGGEAVLDGNGNMVITFSENKIGKSCRAYAAVYDNAGKLIDVRASDMNESIDGSVVLTIPYNAENELKLFFWDGLQIPVHDALTK